MNNIREYHLHKNDYSKLHFEVKEAGPYFQKNYKHAVKAHRHSFYQVLWFKSAGRHYVDYEIVEHPENTIFFISYTMFFRMPVVYFFGALNDLPAVSGEGPSCVLYSV